MNQSPPKKNHSGLSESDKSDWENFTKQIDESNSYNNRKSSSLSESDLAEWENYTKQLDQNDSPTTQDNQVDEESEFLKDEFLEIESDQPIAYSPRRSKQKKPEKLAKLEEKLLRRLKTGEIEIEDKLDLHGFTQVEAKDELLQFVRHSYGRQQKIVLVVTGKGDSERNEFGMQERGIIRKMVPKWLLEDAFHDYVVASSVAFPRHGGEGARYVQIRRKRK